MLKRLIAGMSRNRGGVALLSGAAALLSGVEKTLSTRRRTEAPVGRFHIYRSKTPELGYAYWVLQGSGAYDCFALFDSWNQAVQEAERRLAVARRVKRVPAPAPVRAKTAFVVR